MSAYTTIYLTREAAIALILTRLHSISDEALGNMCDPLVADSLYNVLITNDKQVNDNSFVY
jgi:hypothetical protein